MRQTIRFFCVWFEKVNENYLFKKKRTRKKHDVQRIYPPQIRCVCVCVCVMKLVAYAVLWAHDEMMHLTCLFSLVFWRRESLSVHFVCFVNSFIRILFFISILDIWPAKVWTGYGQKWGDQPNKFRSFYAMH